MTVTLPVKSNYTAKDQLKADECNKFIGQGSSRSSTKAYSEAFGGKANCGQYSKDDRIFVSVEGNRGCRLPLDTNEVLLAVKAGASIIADNKSNRRRPYNVGERELVRLLLANGYKDTQQSYGSLWQPEG